MIQTKRDEIASIEIIIQLSPIYNRISAFGMEWKSYTRAIVWIEIYERSNTVSKLEYGGRFMLMKENLRWVHSIGKRQYAVGYHGNASHDFYMDPGKTFSPSNEQPGYPL